MPVISAGAEAQEAEQGWTPRPQQDRPRGSGRSPCPRADGAVRPASCAHVAWRAVAGGQWLDGCGGALPLPAAPPSAPPSSPDPTSQRSPPTSTPILGLPSYSVASAPPSPPGCLPGPGHRPRLLPAPACHWPAAQLLSPPPSQPAQASCHRELLRVAARKDGGAFPEHHCCPP